MNVYGIFDVTSNRMVNVFLAQNDIVAVRLNVVPSEQNNSPLRKGFNLVKLGECGNGDTICRLVDSEICLNELLEKEGC